MFKKVLPLLVLYFVSSSSLLVLNKVAITAIPNASLLLLIQLGSTVVLVALPALVGKARINFKPDWKVACAYGTVAAVFLSTVYSNFRMIHSVGINPFVVLRCSTPLLVSVLDWSFMHRTLPGCQSVLALCGILLSGAVYVKLKLADMNYNVSERAEMVNGLWWSIIWLVSFLLDMVYIKYVVEVYPCTCSERTLYQNFLALPILAVFLIAGVEDRSVFEVSAEPRAYIALVFTCIAGSALSFTGMSLRTELSATSFTILGIVCKMVSTLLNEIFVEPERDPWRLVCIATVIVSSSFYRQAPLRDASRS